MVLNLRIPRVSSGVCTILFLVATTGLAVGFWLGGGLHYIGDNACADQHPLLNPLIRCNDDASKIFMPEYEEFQNELEAWIDAQKKADLIDDGAVYFRDLVGGPWFGVDETNVFTPASLFKVPVMIAILRAAELVPDLLQEQVVMSGAYAGLLNVEHAGESLKPGQSYSIDELLGKMIRYSDNASADMLKQFLISIDENGESVETIYRELGMLSAERYHQLSVKSYASLFRILFNGRYLGPDMSQKALSLLSQSAYSDALVAGVPPGTMVAHKFGIRDVPNEMVKQFHDCGIVYYPKRPYLLCIMTRSDSTEEGIAFIREVSRRVYLQVDERLKAESGVVGSSSRRP